MAIIITAWFSKTIITIIFIRTYIMYTYCMDFVKLYTYITIITS